MIRRKVLKGATYAAPLIWATPIITSIALPAHAQTSEGTTYDVGETGPCGGIVYEVSNGGLNGKEAAPMDQPAGLDWNDANTSISNLMAGGCTDWYLPDLDELNVLFVQKLIIGGFDDIEYWSSTESDMGASAFFKYFGTSGDEHDEDKAVVMFKMRAIRSF